VRDESIYMEHTSEVDQADRWKDNSDNGSGRAS
jgi:hypothetical protein